MILGGFEILFILAIAPGAFLLWFFATRSYHGVYPALLFRTFGMGVLCAVPAVALNEQSSNLTGFRPDARESGPLATIILAAISVGVVEETCKYTASLTAYADRRYGRVIDGLIYTAAAALGFATIENVLYVTRFGVGTAILRAILAVPLHALCGALMGYPLGLARMDRRHTLLYHLAGLGAAIVVHSLYDFVLFTKTAWALLVIPLSIIAWVIVFRLVRNTYTLDARKEDFRTFGPARWGWAAPRHDPLDITLGHRAAEEDVEIDLR